MVRGLSRNAIIPLTAIGAIGLCLLLLGGVALLYQNVAMLGAGWGQNVQLTVYLDDGVPAERVQQIAAALSQLDGVDEVHVVGPHEAWERLRLGLGDRHDLLDGVEESFLPTSIEAHLAPGIADLLRARPTFERLRHLPGVEEVQLAGEWTRRIDALQHLLAELGLAVGALVLFACLYIVGATIRLGVFARRDEIAIEKLVGATDAFVRAPFLVEGAIEGLFGTSLAALLLYVLFHWSARRLDVVLGSLVAASPLHFFSMTHLIVGLIAGTLLGLVGSAFALGRYVRI